MKQLLSLRLAYSFVVVLIILFVSLGLTNPYGNESSRSIYFGLSTDLTGAIVIIFLVDRIIAANQAKEKNRRRIIGVRGLRYALRNHLAMLFGMFKASITQRPEKEYGSIAELFNDYHVEQLAFLDFSKKAPVLPNMTWYEYLSNECTRFREQLNLTLTKFSTDLDAEMMELLEELIDSPLLAFLIQARDIPVIDRTMGFNRAQNLLMGLGPLIKDYVAAFVKLLEKYNATVQPKDRVALAPNPWRNDVVPKIGDSRVS
ncbi:MAG: hypothetical protein AUI36_00665 [Cyanobacteria bacterium 13_1_40CM_2_61_4]|nr:MAG: hypothetical protein AUI36_00665 [Cyanobacteria bacterium 13_1_40CM_2_61_4]